MFKTKPIDSHVGYLPDEKPRFLKSIIFALQQFLVMLPATVLAALLMHFNIPSAIFASGVATIVFLFVTKGKIPLYYGSSFSYIPAVAIVIASAGDLGNGLVPIEYMGAIQIAIICSGLLSIGAGYLVKYFGPEKIDKVLPATVTGPVAAIIGLSLAGSAVSNAFTINPDSGMLNAIPLIVAVVTVMAIIILTVVLKKGFVSQVPILLGMLIGIFLDVILNLIAGNPVFATSNIEQHTGFEMLQWTAFNTFGKMDLSVLPSALLAIVPVALVTIPESTAHVYQLDLYVNNLAKEKESDKDYPISTLLGDNLIGDGVGDIVATVLGGPAGTNYGENISASAITKNFSSWVFGIAAIIAILLSFTPLASFAGYIPNAVVQGASIYLFGVIAAQGITLMIDKKVDMFNPKNLAVIALVFIIGLGGHYALPNGGFPLYKVDGTIVHFPALAAAAIIGILLNAFLNLIESIKEKVLNRNK
ncbi:MAG: solute carrier family 23 protein [Bacilli bacterium]